MGRCVVGGSVYVCVHVHMVGGGTRLEKRGTEGRKPLYWETWRLETSKSFSQHFSMYTEQGNICKSSTLNSIQTIPFRLATENHLMHVAVPGV